MSMGSLLLPMKVCRPLLGVRRGRSLSGPRRTRIRGVQGWLRFSLGKLKFYFHMELCVLSVPPWPLHELGEHSPSASALPFKGQLLALEPNKTGFKSTHLLRLHLSP